MSLLEKLMRDVVTPTIPAISALENLNRVLPKFPMSGLDGALKTWDDIPEELEEDIQDIIEEKLMSSNRKDVAKAFVLYRNERIKIREKNMKLMKDISEKLSASNVQNQNANVDEKSFGGRVGEASDTVLKQYALDNCMSDMSRNNHLNNEIYIHDLNSYAIGSHNCLSIPFDKLLANGFNTRQTDVRPAQSVSTAFQLIAVIFQLQSLQQFGGVSATHLDWTMVPYVRKSFYKHFKDGLMYIEELSDYKIKYFDAEIEYVGNQSIENKKLQEKYRKAYRTVTISQKQKKNLCNITENKKNTNEILTKQGK